MNHNSTDIEFRLWNVDWEKLDITSATEAVKT